MKRGFEGLEFGCNGRRNWNGLLMLTLLYIILKKASFSGKVEKGKFGNILFSCNVKLIELKLTPFYIVFG